MKLTIIVPDGMIGIDGEFRAVDLSSLATNIRAIQWNGIKGHIEFNDETPNQTIETIDAFTALVIAWKALTPPPLTQEQITLLEQEQTILASKQAKVNALITITVTTSSGKTFDGNETARNNMMSAIISSEFLGVTTANWKLADNTVALVSLLEVKEALALAIQRVGEIVRA